VRKKKKKKIWVGLWCALALAGLLGATSGNSEAPAPNAPPAPLVIDDFDSVAAWKAVPSDGLVATLVEDRGEARLDFDFQGHGGYVVLRREVDLRLPDNYAFTLRVRGAAPPNNLEIKLVDATGDNVWWHVRRNFEFPAEAEARTLRTRKREITFAWGPLGGGEIRQVAAIELAISAGEGGRGTVWLDDLVLEALPPSGPYLEIPRASAEDSTAGAGRAVDGDPNSAWTTDRSAATWTVDFVQSREFGGLALRWRNDRRPGVVRVELSQDGRSWTPAGAIEGAGGAVDWIPVPDGEARYVRLHFSEAPTGLELAEADVLPLPFGAERNVLLATVAEASARGEYPQPFLGKGIFWTVIGRDGGNDEGLLAEDGRLEVGRGGFSIEPFVAEEAPRDQEARGARFSTWADGTFTPSLLDGDLPIPSVRWQVGDGGLDLEVTALAPVDGPARLLARYRLHNAGDHRRTGRLLLALRPLQVNPPWQFLNSPGGVAPIKSLAVTSGEATVDGRSALRFTPAADAAGAQTFAAGSLVEHLRAGRLPQAAAVEDPLALASAVFAWDFDLAPGQDRTVVLTHPWKVPASLPSREAPADQQRAPAHPPYPDKEQDARSESPTPPARQAPPDSPAADATSFERELAAARTFWRDRLSAVRLTLPPAAGGLAPLVRTALAHILINRDGPAIQPGSRSYERSWIRDGALTSSALLRFGLDGPAREFLAWYAPFQFADGKVPCCVDRRGSDPVPENDSHGELIFLAREVHRFTGDRALAERVYPHVAQAVSYIDHLRRQRRTDAYRASGKRGFLGLLPESISHEGYSAKPVHSYWDDFWALRGLRDAVALATVLGHTADAAAWDRSRAEFEADLAASLRHTISTHGLAYIPGSVELADFDATSTTIALDPGRELDRLPAAALRGTFKRYIAEAFARFEGRTAWDAYTPYEFRNVGALVRLGERDTAWRLLQHLVAHRRPLDWNQWPEVVFRDERAPRFLGDLPHTWVGSDFLRAVVDLFWWERDETTLVLADGIPAAWLDDRNGGGPVRAEGLRTPWGSLDLAVERRDLSEPGDPGIRIGISGTLAPPAGARFQLRSPLGAATREVLVDGRTAARGEAAREVTIPAGPAVVEFR
jgi:F5/8 type C domain